MLKVMKYANNIQTSALECMLLEKGPALVYNHASWFFITLAATHCPKQCECHIYETEPYGTFQMFLLHR